MQVPEDIANLTGPPPGAPASIPIGGPGPGPGGPGPGGPGGGLPPELMAALAGGGPNGGPGGGGPGAPSEGSQRSPTDVLGDMRDLAMEYLEVEQDDIDKKVGAKILHDIQSLFAKNQQDQEAAQGVTPAHRGMAKALS